MKNIINTMETCKVLMFINVHSFFFCLFSTLSTQGTLTITPNHSLQGNQTLVSAGGTFEAGLFNIGNSQSQYFGIWYKSISPRTIVWVANRDVPVQSSEAIVTLTDQGNLVIVDGSKGAVWTSNISRIAEKPRMKLGTNLVTGPYRSLTSSKSMDDPASGEFSYHIDAHGFPQLVTTKGEAFYSRAGSWNGRVFNGVSWLRMSTLFNFSFLISDKEVTYQYETLSSETVTRLFLTPGGFVQRLIWSDSKRWEIISTRPMDQCEYYAFCGANSICNVTNSPKICECLEGFEPKSQEWSDGCVRRIGLNCSDDGFLRHTGMKLPDTSSSWYDKSMSLEKCKASCLKHCSCTAYASLDVKGSGCLLWFDDIVDLTKHTDQGQDIYTRLAASEFDRRGTKRSFDKQKLVGALAGVAIFIILLGLATFTYMKRKKLAKRGVLKIFHWKYKREKEDVELSTIFVFSTISSATNHFSDINKLGEGGFGPVYKGILEDGQEIAVKRLSKTSDQGAEQFKNEVMLMAKLQHRNLVKLLGCSIHQNEKLLIYEFMVNRSLDYFIFDSTRSKQLDLAKRLQIIDGIARGLLYLHQDSRLRIIHRDLKSSNILLDNDMNPKISDFGLARSFGADQAEANTNRVMGTYGYMPPEYALHGSFSIKSDVFSFGVIVLEILSGRKNRNFF